jgi:GTP-binding protein YchF
MGFKCGIVGLPNVGKSTLFNALTQASSADAANYPFCTIEPNTGEVAVPDNRLERLAGIVGSKELIPARLTFVDIAGLVEGASKGEGLGNKFLAHIREVDSIAYVLRCFEDDNITHVAGRIDPLADAEIVETELMLADLESMERRASNLEKQARGQDREAKKTLLLVERVLGFLHQGKPARLVELDASEQKLFQQLHLLTAKPVLYVCNVDEASAAGGNELSERVIANANKEGIGSVAISARIEEELAQLGIDDRQEFLSDMGISDPGLDRLVRAGYDLLDLITYFTAGPKEARAWTIRRNTTAPEAAGVIHTDFEKGFIRCETISYDDYIAYNGESGAASAGKMRLEGKEYVVQDGDVLHFRFAT